MGKAIGGLPEAPALNRGAPEEGGDGPPSIGRYLERQRILRGISLEELARLTRIPLRSLERLEAGVYDRQPDGFTRGFVRTVAAAIGLDVEATVARMLPEAQVRRGRARRPWLLLVGLFGALAGVLAVGLAVGAWWRMRPEPGVPRAELPVRRDAVRALAIEQGLLAPDAPTAPRPIAPAPAPAKDHAPQAP